MAAPAQTVDNINGTPDWAAIESLIEQWQPDEFVVGLPLTVEGEEQAITAHVKGFVKALRKRFNLTIHEADERFSSMAAQAELAKMAATMILQNWFTEN